MFLLQKMPASGAFVRAARQLKKGPAMTDPSKALFYRIQRIQDFSFGTAPTMRLTGSPSFEDIDGLEYS